MAYSNAAAVALKERLASGGNAFNSSPSTPKVTTAPAQNTSVAQQKYNNQQAFKAVADSKVAGTYAAKVNNAITATSGGGSVDYSNYAKNSASTGNSSQNNGSASPPPPVDTAKIEKDAYSKGVSEATSKYQAINQGNMDTWTANEQARQQAEAEAIRAKVRAAVAQGTQAQNKIINDAPAQYVDPMNRASFQGANNARAIDERMMAMGLGRSGSNVTAQTSNNNQTSANINDLENTKAKVISDAQAAIANLQASGSLQEVSLVQEAAAKSLERLQAQQNLVEGRQNEQANLIYSNSLNALKTNYDIGANERQLGMQDKTITQNQSNADRSYGLQQDIRTDSKNQWQQSFDKSGTQWDKSFNQTQSNADREYNYNLNKDRGYVNPTGGVVIPDEIRQQLTPYQNDYAQFAKDNAASNPKLAEYATALSNEKMFASPSLLKQFGQQTLQNQQVQSGIQTDVLQRAGLAIDNLSKQYNLDEVLPQELARAKQLISIGEADLAAKIFENTNAPEKFKMDMNTMAQSIEASKANVAQGWKGLDIQQQNANTSARAASAKSASEKFDSNRNMSIGDHSKFMNDRFVKPEIVDGEKTGNFTLDKEGAMAYIDSVGDINMAQQLMPQFNITHEDMMNYGSPKTDSGGGFFSGLGKLLGGK